MSWTHAALGATAALLAACSVGPGAVRATSTAPGAHEARTPGMVDASDGPAPDRAGVCGADEVTDEVEPALPRASGQGQMVSQVLVVGARRLPADWVAGLVSVRPGARLGPTSLADDVKRLRSLDAFERVEVQTARDPIGLAVTFALSERPRIAHVLLEPSDADLTGLDVALPRPGELLDGALARSLRRIEQRWRAGGHLDAQARAWVRRRGERADVCVRLTKGPAWRLERLDFPGAAALPVEELRAMAADPHRHWNVPDEAFREDLLEAARARILAAYHELGRVQAAVGPAAVERRPDGHRLVVSLPVSEGAVFRLGHLAVEGAPPAERRRYLALLGAATGDVFVRSRLAAGLDRVKTAARERLGPDADVEVTTSLQPSDRIDLSLRIEEHGG